MKTNRRMFMKQAALLGAGVSLVNVSALRATNAASPLPGKPGSAANPTLETIHQLHSTHGNFTEQEIPEETLQTILSASVRAANSSNMQSYSIVVVRDRGLMKQVCGYAGSRLLVYCADHNRLVASARSLGHTHEPATITNLITSTVDATLAAQTAAIAARSLGVDYLPTNGVHRGDMTRLWKLLELPPRYCFPVLALVLGYATEQPAHKTGRLFGPGVIHDGKYRAPTSADLEEITRRYDDPSSHLQIGFGQEWKENGHPHYLDWMFTRWMKRRSAPAGEPTEIMKTIKRVGFIET